MNEIEAAGQASMWTNLIAVWLVFMFACVLWMIYEKVRRACRRGLNRVSFTMFQRWFRA